MSAGEAEQQGDWLSPERVLIHPGTLRLPNRRVLGLEQPFAMGRFAVTFDEFDRYCRATGQALKADQGWDRGTLPVLHVSFDEAMEYAAWLTRMTRRRTRLPTGDEWEYAARAGAVTRYCWGDWIEPGPGGHPNSPTAGHLKLPHLS